jgi:hypothetical protein
MTYHTQHIPISSPPHSKYLQIAMADEMLMALWRKISSCLISLPLC